MIPKLSNGHFAFMRGIAKTTARSNGPQFADELMSFVDAVEDEQRARRLFVPFRPHPSDPWRFKVGTLADWRLVPASRPLIALWLALAGQDVRVEGDPRTFRRKLMGHETQPGHLARIEHADGATARLLREEAEIVISHRDRTLTASRPLALDIFGTSSR
jgi:hypothetical protein